MKFSIKRLFGSSVGVFFTGFAFLSICAFWQMYDAVMPKILTNTFAIPETASGVIMALDNVAAVFLLPIFGSISDRCRSPLGKRRPFILYGTLSAVILMIAMPLLDNSYYRAPAGWKLVAFIVVLGLTLIAMGTYRSPAVALMPDITPKPYRSFANAVINFMGAVGGVVYLAAAAILYPASKASEHTNYLPVFAVIAFTMIIALFVVMTFVNEPKLAAKQAEYEAEHPEENIAEDDGDKKKALPKPVRKSLALLLLSIAFWFVGYNGVTTWFTKFAEEMWNMNDGPAATCFMIATVGAILSYFVVGIVSSAVGRKKTIMFGVILLGSCFTAGFIYTLFFHEFHVFLYGLFALVGVAWASINVNSLPMVVEMCKGSDIGKFTGLYYTFSMSAQIITPILAGALVQYIGYKYLFLYSAVFVGLAFVTMLGVKHGDSKIIEKRGFETFDMED